MDYSWWIWHLKFILPLLFAGFNAVLNGCDFSLVSLKIFVRTRTIRLFLMNVWKNKLLRIAISYWHKNKVILVVHVGSATVEVLKHRADIGRIRKKIRQRKRPKHRARYILEYISFYSNLNAVRFKKRTNNLFSFAVFWRHHTTGYSFFNSKFTQKFAKVYRFRAGMVYRCCGQ